MTDITDITALARGVAVRKPDSDTTTTAPTARETLAFTE
jgi:hypothetical protein